MTRKPIFSLSPPRLGGKGPETDRPAGAEDASEPDDIRLKCHFRGEVARLMGRWAVAPVRRGDRGMETPREDHRDRSEHWMETVRERF